MPRPTGWAFSENDVVDLRIPQELAKYSTSGFECSYLFLWVVLVLQHAWLIVAEVCSGVLKAVEEKAERICASSLQTLRQLEQIMLD